LSLLAEGWSRCGGRRSYAAQSVRSMTPARIASAFDEACAANGPIDLLIVNAGIAESAPSTR
jgi:NAD(P)-dependent dehydrogenase (short-subunit alcohol dehydrogenase family)